MTSVLMNPPFSAEWEPDERFKAFGIAPKKKADYAFLMHGYEQLSDKGKMAIILPHGVLFRGNSEGKIRKNLLKQGAVDAVIGLPAKIFNGTDIPTVVLILRKERDDKDILFIDASNEFTKGKNHNYLEDQHLNKIIEAYQSRKDIDKFSHLASYEEIIENDYNLNIPRFVDTFEEEEPISLYQTAKDIQEIDKQIESSEKELFEMLNELVTDDEDAKQGIEMFKKLLGG
ncbi:N-6 DNA methylase [Tetragenococcus halophilus]|uniref:N-6 DNA methylase n=1 Tax=Tetragenococcus halophilus TaxID=51669 RepID=UPI00209BA15C|nr:N-6 DNA methylase [Tetragenococcus halophilus]MCO8294883.1 N-6 DNA methylase [Tetragenococcus halophilus]